MTERVGLRHPRYLRSTTFWPGKFIARNVAFSYDSGIGRPPGCGQRWLPKMYVAPSIRRGNALPNALPAIFARIAFPIFLGSILLAGAPQLRAQSDDSQQSSQDVAEAARQARARKQHAKHVYTNEDLRRAKILTPEDESRAAAANHKDSTAPVSPTAPEAQPLDANSTTPQEPLGSVARRYRNAKKISPFHLPSNQTELAAPKLVAPLVEPSLGLRSPSPSRPENFAPARPFAPLSRSVAPYAPTLPYPRGSRINPFVGRRAQPSPPAMTMLRPVDPHATPRLNSIPAPLPRSSSPASRIVVQPGDTLWNLSRQHLGRGTRWLELLAANPSLNDPMRLVPGTPLTLPSKIATHRRSVGSITVQPGDSLSRIALTAYGHASYWSCLASANSSIANPNQLRIGQVLVLPASCTP